MSFSIINQNCLFGGDPKLPFFENVAKKRAPKKTCKTMGFQQANFWKTDSRHETAIFGQKQTKKSSYLFGLFLTFEQQKHKKTAETPNFIVL